MHKDIELVFTNCERFNLNTPSPSVLAYANHLKKYYRSIYLELLLPPFSSSSSSSSPPSSSWTEQALAEKDQERQARKYPTHPLTHPPSHTALFFIYPPTHPPTSPQASSSAETFPSPLTTLLLFKPPSQPSKHR